MAVGLEAGTTEVAGPRSRRFHGGWILEIVFLRGIYQLYTLIRNEFLIGPRDVAFSHAKQILSIERALWLDHERTIQDVFLPYPALIGLANVYHGPPHLVVTIICFVWLYRRAPERYVRWRNAWIFMLPLALLGFWLYPLMPPANMPERYGIVDTKAEYFNFGGAQRIEYGADGEPTEEYLDGHGNPFAGMPSLHIGWAVWAVLAVWPLATRGWMKALLIGHWVLTFFAISVTGQHALLDIGGGVGLWAAGYGLAVGLDGLAARRRRRGGGWGVGRAGTPKSAAAMEPAAMPSAAPPATSSG
jgi:hypothetical protein